MNDSQTGADRIFSFCTLIEGTLLDKCAAFDVMTVTC